MALQSGIAQDENRALDAILLEIDPCIVALTRGTAYSDEIAQLVRMKMVRPLVENRIENMPSYIRTTVRHEISSYVRQRKPLHPLIVNEEGEVCGGKVLAFRSHGLDDPQVEVEQQEAFAELLEQVVEAILTLPAMQKKAMICALREQMDDPSLLIHAFRQRHVDITTIVWPTDSTERRKLQASCSPARRTLARRFNIDINLYKQRRIVGVRGRKAKRSRNMAPMAV
jgi:DNA-directed RNA polymerase specialized sigma24 family protein